MMTRRKLAAVLAIAAALSAPSLFADPRHDDRTDRDRRYDRDRRVVRVEGRIRDIGRERNGFVISLDRGAYRIFAPANAEVRQVASRGRRGVRQLERGDVIRVRGEVAARNVVYVSSIDLIRDNDRYDRNRRGQYATLQGIVESVDHDRGVLWLRDGRSRRTVAVEVDRNERRYDGYGYDFRDIRRGDRISVDGVWSGGRFRAHDIDRQARAWW